MWGEWLPVEQNQRLGSGGKIYISSLYALWQCLNCSYHIEVHFQFKSQTLFSLHD